MFQKTIELAKKLIACQSVTPIDDGCQEIIAEELKSLGFNIIDMSSNDTQNLWATIGDSGPHFMFAGHTDVVPAGEINAWQHDPFIPTIVDGKLFGRGIADMKGSIAAMLVAVSDFIRKYPNFQGKISFLVTSDEEGPARNGTIKVLERLHEINQIPVDWCIVGEPVSQKILGDTIKLGSRGSLHGEVVFTGKQGHVGHAQRAINPIHKTLNALAKLTEVVWDNQTADFPATSLQITKLHSDSGAENVIPETITCRFNLRFTPRLTPDLIKDEIIKILDTKQELPYSIKWRVSGMPYLSKRGELTEIANKIIYNKNADEPEIRSVGGTSDARFIVPSLQCETIELGLLDTTMHAIDEHVPCQDLIELTQIYLQVLEKLFKVA